MTRYMIIVAIVVAVVLLGVGCKALIDNGVFAGPPKQGTIIDKDFEAAHWESGYRTEYHPRPYTETKTRYNPSTNQTETYVDSGVRMEPVQIWEAQHSWVEDTWSLKLEECKPNGKGKKKCRTGWRDVTESIYDRYQIGDYYGTK